MMFEHKTVLKRVTDRKSGGKLDLISRVCHNEMESKKIIGGRLNVRKSKIVW